MSNFKFKILIFLLFIGFFTISFIPTNTPNTLTAQAQEACKVQSALFLPVGDYKIDGWYKDSAQPTVKIQVATSGCKGKQLQLSVTSSDAISVNDDIKEIDDIRIDMQDNSFILTARAGETECSWNKVPDCQYYITIYNTDEGTWTSKGKSELVYNCDGTFINRIIGPCHESWNFNVSNISFGASILDFARQEATRLSNAAPQSTKTNYTPLAPLPGFTDANGKAIPFETDPTKNPCAIGKYLNVIINLIIGLLAVGAVIMIIIGGLEYMTSELVSSKEGGKERIKNALLGLVIALGAYLILHTINPELLNSCLNNIKPVTIVIAGPDAGDDTIDPDFAKGISTYALGNNVSPEVIAAVEKLKQGWEISQFRVYRNNRMMIGLKKGTETDGSLIINMAPGKNGFASVGTGTTGDGKTPSGNWSIREIRYTPGQAQFNQRGSNMGAAFWLLNPMSTGERGIGIHGNKTGTLSATNGCIRLKNGDILALQPYIKVGIPVFID